MLHRLVRVVHLSTFNLQIYSLCSKTLFIEREPSPQPTFTQHQMTIEERRQKMIAQKPQKMSEMLLERHRSQVRHSLSIVL